jgi:menaquinone-dependent protoporphyrinogen oxidase
MSNKILVTYSSRTDFTEGVASAIKQTLEENILNVELQPMNNVKDLSSYQVVIIGSAIQDRQWLPESIEFLKLHQKKLSEIPVATFSVCMTLAMKNGEKYRPSIIDWLNPVRNLVKPISEGIFAGGLNISKIPKFADRLKFRISVLFGVWKEGDHRNWNAIQTWTKNLTSILEKRE